MTGCEFAIRQGNADGYLGPSTFGNFNIEFATDEMGSFAHSKKPK
jgi:hypothetical protein